MTLIRQESGEFVFRNPVWTTSGTITVEVEHDEFGWIPFNASGDDSEDYGRELFELLSTKYVDQVEACSDSAYHEEAVDDALSRRKRELNASDWTQNSDVPEATRTLWVPYRQALRDITAQTGYPNEITWPTPPA